MLPGADAAMYRAVLEAVVADAGIDAALAIFVTPLMIDTTEVALAIMDVASRTSKPVLVVMMSEESFFESFHAAHPAHPPFYRFPEEAAKVLGAMREHAEWRALPEGTLRAFEADRAAGRAIVAANAGGYLPPKETEDLLRAYGIPIVNSVFAATLEEVFDAARTLGYPVVVKAHGAGLVHKTEIGAVEVDIHDGDELALAVERIRASLASHSLLDKLAGFQVQEMVRGGRETILGLVTDERVGPLLMFGLGGTFVEVFKDVRFRAVPITDVEASAMVRSIAGARVLHGVRGEPGVDIDYIEEMLSRLSKLATDCPEIVEIDLNPFVFAAARSECKVLDARVRVA
jgi:acetyltransferase